MLDLGVQIPLAVEVNLLLTGLIFKAQLVKAAALMGLGAQHGAALVARQLVGRAIGGVKGAPGDDRLVRVAFEEADNHLMTHARYGEQTILATGPALSDPHPAGALVVGTAITIPGELQLHPAMLIAVDLFALGADHGGDLRAIDPGFVRHQAAPGLLRLDGTKLVAKGGGAIAALFLQRLGLGAGVADLHYLPVGVEAGVGVFSQGKAVAWLQGGTIGLPLRRDGIVA